MAEQTQTETLSLSSIMADQAVAKHIADSAGYSEDEIIKAVGVVPAMINKTVQVGINAISDPAIQAKLRKDIPGLDLDRILELPAIANSYVKVAAAAVPSTAKSPLKTFLDEGVPLKRKITAELMINAEFGLIPMEKLEAYKAGSGITNTATDLIDGAAMLRAVDRTKSRLTDADLDRAQELGKLIMANSKPTNANVPSEKLEKQKTADIRDRIFTLLSQRYSELRAAAYYLWRDDFGARVPPLQTRRRQEKEAKPA